MENFKATVPADLQAKVKAFIDDASFDDIVTGYQSFGLEAEETREEIEGNYRSGWLPRQDGGFMLRQWARCDEDSSYHFTEKQTEWVNEQSKQCWNAFLSDNGIDSETSWDGLTEEQQSECSDYENEWFRDGAMLELQVFVNGYSPYDSGADLEERVTIRLSINYKDAPYFRERDAEDIKTEILTVAEFMAQDNAAIIERFKI